jgi:hypothetical protein
MNGRTKSGRLAVVKTDLRTAVLLSMQRALWEQVTPDLRGVAVAWSGELDGQAQITARFLYQAAVGEVQAECVSLTETYLLADFLEGTRTTFVAVAFAELDLQPNEEWVFRRWEPTSVVPHQTR